MILQLASSKLDVTKCNSNKRDNRLWRRNVGEWCDIVDHRKRAVNPY